MTDKKVLNYHIPSDFDPSRLLPSAAMRNRNISGVKMVGLRMMLPFTMKCDTCANYIATGTKFTAKSAKIGEEYGIDVYRFHAKCKFCAAEFVFRSEPKISDYILESGGVRQYEHEKDARLAAAMDEVSGKESGSDDDKDKHTKEIQNAQLIETLKSRNRTLGRDREATIDKVLNTLKRKREEDDDEWKRLTKEEVDDSSVDDSSSSDQFVLDEAVQSSSNKKTKSIVDYESE